MRSFTIEPRRTHAPDREPPHIVPTPGKGPRLFNGDAYVLTQKYHSNLQDLIRRLEDGSVAFTVTGFGTGESNQAYVRLAFQCVQGVFIETVRNRETPALRGINRKLLATVALRAHQSFRIVCKEGQAVHAAHDLVRNRLVVLVRGSELGIMDAEIHGSDYWQVLQD